MRHYLSNFTVVILLAVIAIPLSASAAIPFTKEDGTPTGLREGDIILSVNQERVKTTDDLFRAAKKRDKGIWLKQSIVVKSSLAKLLTIA